MPMSQDFNPFANQDIHVPKAFHEDLRLYSSTFTSGGEESTKDEEAPFKRYVDFWLLAAAMGAEQRTYLPVEVDQRHRFITGSVFQRDLAIIEFLLFLAIAHTNDPFVVVDPRKVMDIAEGYAAGGIPLVKEMIETGHLTALHNLTRSLVKSLSASGESGP
ncbi:hypothetical protein [Candidatus Poriferisocius sp.]|uniref:hypothetical protein n=1 Tax=Candidatus Poriferisocius sp. TaxID=3101276 RepID=UPI003B017688